MRTNSTSADGSTLIKRGIRNGVEWVHAATRSSRGVVFVPPWIGGAAIQQIRMLRHLMRHGLELISFNYAGHGGSNGRFSLRAAYHNCESILEMASSHCRHRHLPLFGLAASYATMPLLHAAAAQNEPMHRLVLISAVPQWRLRDIGGNFWQYWRQSKHWRLNVCHLSMALRAYRDELLPGVRHRPQAFGILARQRVQWSRFIFEVLYPPLLGPAALQRTPVMCVYGRNDHLLQQLGFYDWRNYEVLMQSICPHSQFVSLNSDHFLSCPHIRNRLMDTVARYFTIGT